MEISCFFFVIHHGFRFADPPHFDAGSSPVEVLLFEKPALRYDVTSVIVTISVK